MEESTQTEAKSTFPLPIIGLVVLVVVLGIGGFFLLQSNKSNERTKQEAAMQEEKTEQPENAMTQGAGKEATSAASATNSAMTKNVKAFAVEGSNFSFTPKEIKVKKGDTVKVTFTNKAGTHDFVIDEFSVKTRRLKTGEGEDVTFVASKSGTFEYYCSVGTHRQMGMVGKLIIE